MSPEDHCEDVASSHFGRGQRHPVIGARGPWKPPRVCVTSPNMGVARTCCVPPSWTLHTTHRRWEATIRYADSRTRVFVALTLFGRNNQPNGRRRDQPVPGRRRSKTSGDRGQTFLSGTFPRVANPQDPAPAVLGWSLVVSTRVTAVVGYGCGVANIARTCGLACHSRVRYPE